MVPNVHVPPTSPGKRAAPDARARRRGQCSRAPWSDRLTVPLAAAVPPAWRLRILAGIRAIHTAIFGSVAACIAIVVWDGLRQRPRRRTRLAGAAVLAEAAVYLSNEQVCPLTPLAESLGAAEDCIGDMLLPERFSRRIPAVSSTVMLAGIGLNLLAWARRRREGRWLVG